MRYALRLLAIIPPADSRRNPMKENVRIYIQPAAIEQAEPGGATCQV
jgi:hypothetical protein